MLSLVHAEAAYGESRVLFDVNLEVPDGSVVTLLGRNGMGKTTTVRAIMGLVAPRRGLAFDGMSIDAATPEAIARRGIGLVPEGRLVFPTLTVRENLIATAANRSLRADPWTAAADLRPFSAACRTRQPVCEHAVGRRTADAGGGPRADDQSKTADSRRGHRRPGAGGAPRDLALHRCPQGAGTIDPV